MREIAIPKNWQTRASTIQAVSERKKKSDAMHIRKHHGHEIQTRSIKLTNLHPVLLEAPFEPTRRQNNSVIVSHVT